MSSIAAPVRRLVGDVLGVPDLAARVARSVAHSLTRAIDREQADAAAEHEAGTLRLPLEARLRLATFFALACGVVFLPVEGSRVGRDVLESLLILYVVHAALTSFVLIASFTALGERHADKLAMFLVIGHAVNLHVFVWMWDPLESTCRHASLSIL